MGKKGMRFGLLCVFVLSMIAARTQGVEPVLSMDNQVQISGDHSDPTDYIWDDSKVTQIVLNGTSITVDGDETAVDGSKVTLLSAGTYSISGSLTDGQIVVNTQDEEVVRILLNGVNISSSTSAPIYVASAAEVVIVLEDNTENYVADGATYIFENVEEDEPNAAIFSKSNLTIYGNGSLTVAGNYNDGIASKDGLVITSGTVTVSSVDDGIRGKDYLVVKDGNITVNAQGDGLKSDNAEDATLGYIAVETGRIQVSAGGDALQAETNVVITDGSFILSSGGGSNSSIDETTSAKGIKGVVSVTIDGGNFTIDSADDAIHSNNGLVINGGAFTISSGDDGIHADSTLAVNGGDINITKSYEGIESAIITINNGNIFLTSSDDGLNVAGGIDGSGMNPGPGRGGGRGQAGGPGQDMFAASSNTYLYINGGSVVINAAGDGIDVNGAIEMTSGTVIVNGPTERMNGALDYDRSFKMTGGFLVAAGSSGMAQAPDESSTQYSVLLNFDTTQQAGTVIHIRTSEGNEILTFSPAKEYQSVAFSSSELLASATYEVYYGGSANGSVTGGLYQDGSYTPGTQYTSFTISGVVTWIGNAPR